MSKRNILSSYKKHPSLTDYLCFYCGSYAEGADHVPPVSWTNLYPECEKILVRCCVQCNGLLGANNLPTLADRANFLAQKLRRKLVKNTNIPDWSDDEIDDLSGALKRRIIQAMKKKKDSIRRISHIDELALNLTYDHMLDVP